MGDEPKQYLVERLRRALAHDPNVGELDLHVKVVGDDVFVRGTVATTERHTAISRALAELAPGYRTHNEVTVLAPMEGPTEERIE